MSSSEKGRDINETIDKASIDKNTHTKTCDMSRTEYMRFKQKWTVYIQSGKCLKLVKQFTYLGSIISSTESDVYIRLTNARNAIDSLSIIRKSDKSDKIKRDFFQVQAVSILQSGCTIWTLTKHKS